MNAYKSSTAAMFVRFLAPFWTSSALYPLYARPDQAALVMRVVQPRRFGKSVGASVFCYEIEPYLLEMVLT